MVGKSTKEHQSLYVIGGHMSLNLTGNTKIDHPVVPANVIVVGSRYKVNLGPSVKPQVHLVDRQRQCSCILGKDCPAVKAVAEYLRNGGQRAFDSMPPCPICGAFTTRDRKWDGRYTHEIGWRCMEGGLSHFLQAKAREIQKAISPHKAEG
jgi:hypothetical protein